MLGVQCLPNENRQCMSMSRVVNVLAVFGGGLAGLQAKIINKERVIKTRQVEHTFNEKNILFAMENNFIVKLFDYFQVRRHTNMSGNLAPRGDRPP